MAGCVTPPTPTPPAAAPPVGSRVPPLQVMAGVIARNERFVVVVPRATDTFSSLAREFLGSAARAWEIAAFNVISAPVPGQALAIPLRPVNAPGIAASGYQTVPILCYHRIGPRASLMIMPRDTFAAQMEYLARNRYHVIRLAELPDFLSGKRALPPRAVVLTFDDGHVSTYQTPGFVTIIECGR